MVNKVEQSLFNSVYTGSKVSPPKVCPRKGVHGGGSWPWGTPQIPTRLSDNRHTISLPLKQTSILIIPWPLGVIQTVARWITLWISKIHDTLMYCKTEKRVFFLCIAGITQSVRIQKRVLQFKRNTYKSIDRWLTFQPSIIILTNHQQYWKFRWQSIF